MPAVKKGTTPGAAPELMSDFVLDDEATAVSQPDIAPSFASSSLMSHSFSHSVLGPAHTYRLFFKLGCTTPRSLSDAG